MSQKIKVYFILPTLFAGGAERVISFISQNLNQDKFDVKLIVIGFEKSNKYIIENIPVSYLNKNRILHGILSITRILNVEKPDIVLSSIGHLNALMGLISILFPKIIFIGRVASVSKISSKYSADRKSIFHKISKISRYGITKLDYIICQSADMKSDFIENFRFDISKIIIINNPITLLNFNTLKKGDISKRKRFLTVGRLTEIKGHLRILEILSKLDYSFIYTIVGDGPQKNKILEKAKSHGILNQINFITYTEDIYDVISENDFYLQGSYSEGFPNALLESCVAGTPAIAFDVPGGTREIIEDRVNGFLVNSNEEFLERLTTITEWDPELIRESVFKKFNKEKIISEYENLFINILRCKIEK